MLLGKKMVVRGGEEGEMLWSCREKVEGKYSRGVREVGEEKKKSK